MKVIISGGGTGGHIFPAIAIANALKKSVKDIDILFVGAKGKMEMEKVPAAGYEIKGLWISGLQRRLTYKNLLFPFKVLSSIYRSRKIIKSFKPDVVIGVGGYASGPMLKAATGVGIPTVIQEQNSFPGITNKILAKKVDKICVAYEGMEKFFPKDKIVLTGNPVRQDIINSSCTKEDAVKFFELDSNKKTVLVIGGSLGARTINECINNILPFFVNNNIQLIWQTGKSYYSIASENVNNITNTNIKIFEFINRMDYAYKIADIIISRAGAIAISELCLVGKPVILIPSPNVAEDHQTKNALSLSSQNAAIVVKDINAKESLSDVLSQLISNFEKQKELSTNMLLMAHKNAADKIVEVILNLVKYES